LAVLAAQEWYQELSVHTLRMAKTLWGTVSAALDTFGTARLLADMRWVTDSAVSPDTLCHWEASANTIFDGTGTRVVCQYDLSHQSPSEVLAALRTHPLVILDGKLVSNVYYEAPEILAKEPHLNHTEADSKQIALMLSSLKA
jgi:hypothetical protein